MDINWCLAWGKLDIYSLGAHLFYITILRKKLIPIHKVGKWGHIYTMCCVVICWVIFRSESVMSAFHYIVKMFGIGVPFVDETSLLTLKGVGGLLVISVLHAFRGKTRLL